MSRARGQRDLRAAVGAVVALVALVVAASAEPRLVELVDVRNESARPARMWDIFLKRCE